MAEVGQVIEVKGPHVVVKLERNEACGSCKACNMGIETEMFLEAQNVCGAQVGDLVQITLEQKHFMKAVFIMYVIPLIALLGGLLLGFLVSHNEGVSIVVGLAALGVTYVIIHKRDKGSSRDQYRPIASGIVTDEGVSKTE